MPVRSGGGSEEGRTVTAASDPLVLESLAATVRDQYRFRTVDGVHAADAFRAGELLALERLWERDVGRLLCVEAGYGVVGTVLGEAAETVRMTESSARAAALCERNATANGVDATVDSVAAPSASDARFDTAVYVPKPYTPLEFGYRRIADSLELLAPGRALFVAAKPETGLRRYVDELERLTGRTDEVASRDGWTLLRSARPESFDPPTYVEPRRLEATVDGTDLALVTLPGVFAATGLDDGTRLLAESAEVTDCDRVLDLCCGYGPLGAYAGLTADCEVWCSDDDRVATRCAERTLTENGVDGTVVTADCTDGVRDRTFDRVLCNPPTHAGDGVLSDLFAGVADVLAGDGRLSLVHHRALDLRPSLSPFERVETVARGAEHVVLEAML